MSPFKLLIVDDESLARDELKYLLAQYTDLIVVGEADNGAEAVGLARKHAPDVVFLDIQMPGMTGCETARAMLALSPKTLIVFATAYDEYAVKAFEIGAVDYLLKPFDAERIAQTVARLRALAAHPQQWLAAVRDAGRVVGVQARLRKLPVERLGRISLVDFDDIVLAHAAGGEVQVKTGNGSFMYRGTLSDLETRLGGERFLRVHKSYLVNLEKIADVIPWFKGTYWLSMADADQTQVPVSKMLIKDLKTALGLT